MIILYGASDDLVEIEGDVQEEIGCYEKAVLVTIGRPEVDLGQNAYGVQVRMSYGDEAGVWAARIAPIDEDVPIPWPVRVSAWGYSAHVVVECPPGTPVTWRVERDT